MVRTVAEDSENYTWRRFCAITNLFLKILATIMPKRLRRSCNLFGFVWMFWLRVLLLLSAVIVFFTSLPLQ